MKKIILSVLILGMATVSFAEKKVTKTATNGGPDGYSGVEEKHDNHGSLQQVSTLICNNPGYESCTWSLDPVAPNGGNTSTITIENAVMTLINAGQLTGDLSYSDCVVTWEADDNLNYSITTVYADDE